jgi:hypothetical protein
MCEIFSAVFMAMELLLKSKHWLNGDENIEYYWQLQNTFEMLLTYNS